MAEPLRISDSLRAVMARPLRGDPAVYEGFLSGDIATLPPRARYSAKRPYLGGLFTPKRYQRSPDRERSIRRRRQLAASGPLPPTMACHLTTGEQAVARIIADEVANKGSCDRSLDEIAARAGVCHKTAQRAMRRLGMGKHSGHDPIVGMGWITIEERPVKGRKHLTNIVRIVADQWLMWIERGPRRVNRGDRGTFASYHGQHLYNKEDSLSSERAEVQQGQPRKVFADRQRHYFRE
jgi:hypothetical protein